jgi:hypothetical protein
MTLKQGAGRHLRSAEDMWGRGRFDPRRFRAEFLASITAIPLGVISAHGACEEYPDCTLSGDIEPQELPTTPESFRAEQRMVRGRSLGLDKTTFDADEAEEILQFVQDSSRSQAQPRDPVRKLPTADPSVLF